MLGCATFWYNKGSILRTTRTDGVVVLVLVVLVTVAMLVVLAMVLVLVMLVQN
jgi:hypothetical protein